MSQYTMEDWLQMERELTRQRGLWGPPVGSELDKWMLDMTEGFTRHSSAFYCLLFNIKFCYASWWCSYTVVDSEKQLCNPTFVLNFAISLPELNFAEIMMKCTSYVFFYKYLYPLFLFVPFLPQS